MRSSEKWLGEFNRFKYKNFSSHKRGMGLETQGESNNYGIGDLNIQFMGSYVGEGLFFDGGEVNSLYLSRFDMFNIKLSSQARVCLLIDYSLINRSVLFYFSLSCL